VRRPKVSSAGMPHPPPGSIAGDLKGRGQSSPSMARLNISRFTDSSLSGLPSGEYQQPLAPRKYQQPNCRRTSKFLIPSKGRRTWTLPEFEYGYQHTLAVTGATCAGGPRQIWDKRRPRDLGVDAQKSHITNGTTRCSLSLDICGSIVLIRVGRQVWR
jgi:hypothetical protein